MKKVIDCSIRFIMANRGMKTVEIIKEEVHFALKERGYSDKIIEEWFEYVE
jgi:hypothetical protein